jgi:hypothetical protein
MQISSGRLRAAFAARPATRLAARGPEGGGLEVDRAEAWRAATRLKQIRRAGHLPEAGLDYMVVMLVEAGPTMTTGMGAAPLTHGEIDAYQRNTGACGSRRGKR